MDIHAAAGPVALKGFFTKQIYLQGKTLSEIESHLGFHTGRLRHGASFFTPINLPYMDDFDFAGYTQVAEHHTKEQYGEINRPKNKWDKSAHESLKKSVMSMWSLTGSDRLIKVVPVILHNANLDNDYQYPPGDGVPQWKLKSIQCRRISSVSRYPKERFIPDQGYIAVNYGRGSEKN